MKFIGIQETKDLKGDIQKSINFYTPDLANFCNVFWFCCILCGLFKNSAGGSGVSWVTIK